jgi:intracellular septation protein
MKLLIDFFPVLLFFLAYKLANIYVATGVAIVASALQVGWFWVRRRRVETMHLVTLGLLVVFGGATILLHDRTFIMWKPSIVNWLFAAAFLASQLFGDRPLVERMMSQAVDVPKETWRRLNLTWVAFFVISGLANLYVANGFFIAEHALLAAAGPQPIDLTNCGQAFTGELLSLCRTAAARESTWVNFKLFGMLGLTIVFVIGQAFYLARHMRDREAVAEAK